MREPTPTIISILTIPVATQTDAAERWRALIDAELRDAGNEAFARGIGSGTEPV